MTDHHTSPRITIVVPLDQRRQIEDLAAARASTISDVIRRAIDEYLRMHR